MIAVRHRECLQIFLLARGGCGKAFLLNVLLDAVISPEPGGCIALAMATSGIAARLLHLGRTFHSRMEAPLHPRDTSTLHTSAQSNLATLVQKAKLLLIDEVTMLHQFQLEALYRTLRDLMGNENQPFGGKVLILAGDFRQCLPVKACLNKLNLWKHLRVLSLMENMRVRAGANPGLEDFDRWTLSLGDGSANKNGEPIAIPNRIFFNIEPNSDIDRHAEERSMKEFCNQIFTDLRNNLDTLGWLEGRSILAPTNVEVDTINDLMESYVPGAVTKLTSSDTSENYQYPRPNDFPRHIITLKTGMPLMPLCKLSPKEGLCNDTKLIYQRALNNKIIICKLIETGKVVLIPRIKFV